MAWYVIQTYTGEEEKLVEMIRCIVPDQYYDACFVIYYEQLRHRHQENQIHVLRLFPGYVFISSNQVEELFRHLKTVPAMSKIMASDLYTFTPLGAGEAEFLLDIMDTDHVVRLSYAATDGKDHVTGLSGPLEKCREQIVSYHFRKRYAVIRLMLEGRKKEVKLGIILNDDVRREISYGKMEAGEKPEKYTIPIASAKKADKTLHFAPGDRVVVVEGAFAGSTATVSQVKKDVVRISVQMFGREIMAEVPAGSVREEC